MNARLSRTLLAVAIAAALPLLLSACDDNDDAPPTTVRDTAYGRVEGTADAATGTYSWKGVPYAKPPVGALRWKAPVDPDAWTDTRKTQQFGNACVQYGRIYGPGANNTYDATIGTTLNQAVGQEDCLYLNVWRPTTNEGNLPVIVFVHGGSNVSGYTADPVYDGAALAKAANAVVVTVNYRLGIFGWLSLPQLKDGSSAENDSGNFAILDLVKAMRFVNRNAAAFGGNPGNVTLMGQSAGAIDVYALMVSPLMVNASPQLFHRAVPLSGGLSLLTNLPAGTLIPTMNALPVAQAQGTALLQQAVIADGLATDVPSAQAYIAGRTSAQLADYLRGKTPAALLGLLLTRLAPQGLASTTPIPEGTVVPTDAIAAIKAGRYVKVPILAGNTRAEGKLFPTFLALSPTLGGASGRLVTDAQLVSIQAGYQPDAAPQIGIEQWIPASLLPVTTPTTGFNARTAQLDNAFLLASSNNMMQALKGQQSNLWYYRFDWDEEPAPWNDIYGAAHLFDMPFIFGTFGPSVFANVTNSTANRPGRLALSGAMMQSLAAFARNGDPNNAALGVTWPTWPSKLIFDATKTDKVISVQ